VTADPLDLGLGHVARFTVWAPDRALNPQYDSIPDVDPAGLTIDHLKADGTTCSGALMFDGETTRQIFPDQDKWTIESLDPLTVSPSVLCSCGDHGFIREGRWVPA
jgi:hypothetical protein